MSEKNIHLATNETLSAGLQGIAAAIGGGVTIDSAMSSTSENPVQNKAIKAYVDANCGGGLCVEVAPVQGESERFASTTTFQEVIDTMEDGGAVIFKVNTGMNNIYLPMQYVMEQTGVVLVVLSVMGNTLQAEGELADTMTFAVQQQ